VKKLLLLSAALVALALVATGCGPAAAYSATVNGHRISQTALNDELEAIRANKTYAAAIQQQLSQGGERLSGSGKGTFDSSFVAHVLTRQVYLEIVRQGLDEHHIKVTDAQLKDARDQQQQQFQQQFGNNKVWNAFTKAYQDTLVRRSAEVTALQDGLAKNKVDDKAIKAYYDAHTKDFEQTCVRHILAAFPGLGQGGAPQQPSPDQDAAAKAKAQSWKDRIAKGEDFAAIAKAESGDTGSGAQGGDLGCEGGFVKEFTDAEAALQPGQVSDPVRTQFGWHIIEVTSRKTKSLDDATPDIKKQLEQDQQSVVSDFLQKALTKAKVTVNPKYGHFDKGDPKKNTQPQVVPPKGPTTSSTTAPGGLGGTGDTGGAGTGSGSSGGSPNP
jgi:foldase protein PrsA